MAHVSLCSRAADTAIIVLNLWTSNPSSRGLWQLATVFQAAHMIPAVWRGKAASIMWEFMTRGFRDFGASEAEVKGFLDNYQRVEKFRTWAAHVPSFVLVCMAVARTIHVV